MQLRTTSAGTTGTTNDNRVSGDPFAAAVFTAVAHAAHHPHMPKRHEHPALPATPEVRKIQLSQFDEYGIVYTIDGETLWIMAVAHAKRTPGYWIDRIPGTP